MGDSLNLKLSNHPTVFVSKLRNMLEQEKFIDVTLIVEGHRIEVHRLVLCVFSQLFEEHFNKQPNTSPQEVAVEDVRAIDLLALVNFMYEGEVTVAKEQLPLLLEAASHLQIQELIDSPQAELQKTPKEQETDYQQHFSGSLTNPISTADNKMSVEGNEDQTGENNQNQKIEEKRELLVMRTDIKKMGDAIFGKSVEESESSVLVDVVSNAVPIGLAIEGAFVASSSKTARLAAKSIIPPNEIKEQNLFKCDKCRHSFYYKANLKRHQLMKENCVVHHPPVPVFKCDKCKRSYKSKCSLTRHVNYECAGVLPSILCTLCDSWFKRRSDLRKHLSRVHGVDPSVK